MEKVKITKSTSFLSKLFGRPAIKTED